MENSQMVIKSSASSAFTASNEATTRDLKQNTPPAAQASSQVASTTAEPNTNANNGTQKNTSCICAGISKLFTSTASFLRFITKSLSALYNLLFNGLTYCKLMSACEDNNIEKVRSILQKKNIDKTLKMTSFRGFTPLMEASKFGHNQIVRALLEVLTEHDINKQNKKGDTAFMIAVREGKTDTAKILSEVKGFDPNILNKDGCSALHLAVKYHKAAMMPLLQLILNIPNIQVNSKDKHGNTALIYAADNNKTFVNTLLECEDVEINAQNKKGSTALIQACKSGLYQIVDTLDKDMRLQIDTEDNNGLSALAHAVNNRQYEVVRIILESKHACRSVDSCFLRAASNGNVEILKLFIQNTKNINYKDCWGNTALILAATQERFSAVQMLLKCEGIDCNAVNDSNRTALFYAVKNGNNALVELLVSQPNIKIGIADNNGLTPEALAQNKLYSAKTLKQMRQQQVRRATDIVTQNGMPRGIQRRTPYIYQSLQNDADYGFDDEIEKWHKILMALQIRKNMNYNLNSTHLS